MIQVLLARLDRMGQLVLLELPALQVQMAQTGRTGAMALTEKEFRQEGRQVSFFQRYQLLISTQNGLTHQQQARLFREHRRKFRFQTSNTNKFPRLT